MNIYKQSILEYFLPNWRGFCTFLSAKYALFIDEREVSGLNQILSGKYKAGKQIRLWDGKTAERIVAIIKHNYSL